MSKPTTPGELRDVKVDAISLVTKAANKKTFKIFKSADKNPESDEKRKVPVTSVTKDEVGLFSLLKSFFTSENIAKGEMEDKYRAAEKRDRFNKAIDVLQQLLGYRWDSKGVESDVKKIKSALSDFQKICEEILLGTDSDIKKFADEVQKSGRKISASRLTEIKAAQAALAKIIEEADGESDAEGDAKVVKDLEKFIKDSVEESIKPLVEKLDSLEKSDEDAADGSGVPETNNAKSNVVEKKDDPTESEISEIIKTSIAEAMTPLGERLEKLEKVRNYSNKIPEESEVKKEKSVFAGAFTGN